MTTCSCDTFSSSTTSVACTFSNTNTTSGGAAYMSCAGNWPALECHSNTVNYGTLWIGNGSSTGFGVTGWADYSGAGVWGHNNGYDPSTAGPGVQATSYHGHAIVANASEPSNTTGARGVSSTGTFIGVYGVSTSRNWFIDPSNNSGIGVYGEVDPGQDYGLGQGYGVYGISPGGSSTHGYAGYFYGKGHFAYNLEKGGGGFLIDHPNDPENLYLNHGFVEAPEMSNLYKGEETLDANGEVIVTLPDYFVAANKDAVPTVTARSGPMPSLWASGDPCVDGTFKISGGTPGGKVSWIVMTVRNDPYAKMYMEPTVKPKRDHDKGMFLHPECHGHGKDKSINDRIPSMVRAHNEANKKLEQPHPVFDKLNK